jgi:hypothetical protein
MVFHFTHAMRKKFDCDEVTEFEVPTRPHLSWYLNTFTVNRVQYILATNAASLFSIVFFKRGVRDYGDLRSTFFMLLEDQLTGLDLKLIYERIIAPATGRVVVAKTFNRSVLGSMNDMVHAIKSLKAREELSPWELSNTLNSIHFSAIRYRTPHQCFPQLPLE